MLTDNQRDFLSQLFPGDGLILDPEQAAPLAVDSSGRFALPWAAVRPQTEEQIAELLRFAQAEDIPVYPRARGTSRVGGAVPAHGGVVVSLLRMNRVLDVDEADFAAEVEPGVVTGEFQALLKPRRLYYPPDPASAGYSTLGGNAATCAGGMRAVKYGVTRDYVLGLSAALPGGSIIRPGGRCHKDVSGLDLTRLFVGSGGTLGIITRLTLKLLPLPEAQASLLAAFADMDAALAAARMGFAAGILPVSLEFLDDVALEAVARTGCDLCPPGAGAALLFRLDGSEGAVLADLERLRAALEPARPLLLETAATPGAEERLWEIRRTVSQALHRMSPDKSGEDVAVPRGRIPAAVAAFREAGKRERLRVACFGHLGDGNIHVNVLYDAQNPDQLKRAHNVKESILRAALDLGGTLTGEHGLGLSKGPYIAWRHPPGELAALRAVKAAFDPRNIMNPGKEWG
jgi:glycolate oxidase subunit GlcD